MPPSPGLGEPGCHLTSTPKRRCEMQLLLDELDQLELSYLQDPSCPEQSPMVAGDPRTSGAVSLISSSQRTKPSLAALPRHPVTRRSLRGVTMETGPGPGHLWEARPYSPSQRPASNVSSLSPRLLCQGLTRAGQRCRKRAVPGQVFCQFHGCRQMLSPQT
ncbi:protein brambleberry-like [Nothoprocta perdicaria]|uniref:protein brambleberry-like n=1 Tax=Nothoprocta perdicaria TaxID=30464 RepID=UPI000E1BEB89|nr:protein brambleberry-like [Nothoprocta perdicaria]